MLVYPRLLLLHLVAGKKAPAIAITSFFSPKSKGSATILKPGTKRPRASSEISDENEVKVKKHPRTSTTHSDTVTRKYNANWKKEFTWVNFDPQKNAMYCTFCQEAGAEIAGKTDFVTGCTSFKKETLSIHGRSHRHTRARDHVLGKQKPASEGTLSAVFQKMRSQNDKDAQKEMTIKINTAYFVAKEELPFTKYKGLVQLQKKNGLEVGVTYANDTKCAEMTGVIGKLLADDVSKKLKEAHFISVLIDGASDVSGIENETIHCKMVQNGRAVTRLIGHKAVENANTTGKN